MQVPEYDLNDQSTWTVLPAPPVDPSFHQGLIDIAGRNPHGAPALTLVWASTHVDPQSTDGSLKYHLADTEPVLCGFEYVEDGERKFAKRLEAVPPSVLLTVPKYESHQLGERRFIVEIWRSPEFLERTGRYRQLRDDGQITTYFECRNCGGFVPTAPETAKLDIERICPSCQSKRVSPVDVREDGEGRLLKPIPTEGCYDFFYRIERANGTYHPPDAEALEGIRLLWLQHLKPFKKQTAALNAQRQQTAAESRRRRREIWHPDNLLTKQKEETL